MSRFAAGLRPPYYAVIFTAQQSDDLAGYGEMADATMAAAADQPGYLGVETTRDGAGLELSAFNLRHRIAKSPRAPEARQGFGDSMLRRNALGITVSYWRDEAALTGWKAHARHLLAQKLGRERWYEHYELRVTKVERAYSGPEGRG